jgi:hypothetical protein
VGYLGPCCAAEGGGEGGKGGGTAGKVSTRTVISRTSSRIGSGKRGAGGEGQRSGRREEGRDILHIAMCDSMPALKPRLSSQPERTSTHSASSTCTRCRCRAWSGSQGLARCAIWPSSLPPPSLPSPLPPLFLTMILLSCPMSMPWLSM